MYTPQDHCSTLALVFQMPNFENRDMRGSPRCIQILQQWGPPLSSWGGRGVRLAMRGHPTTRYCPLLLTRSNPLKICKMSDHPLAQPGVHLPAPTGPFNLWTNQNLFDIPNITTWPGGTPYQMPRLSKNWAMRHSQSTTTNHASRT